MVVKIKIILFYLNINYCINIYQNNCGILKENIEQSDAKYTNSRFFKIRLRTAPQIYFYGRAKTIFKSSNKI